MSAGSVIFDMDGLLINSEPYWEEAGKETLQQYGAALSSADFFSTTGLRTREWIDWWFSYFHIDKSFINEAIASIIDKGINKIKDKAEPMPGAGYIINYFKKKGFKIGLATSSPEALIHVVTEKLNITNELDAWASAEKLSHGKPHPEVYLHCARLLGVSPVGCICFEDSVNGMIAAKAARMKCVVVPPLEYRDNKKFGLADLQLSSLADFDDTHFATIE